MARISLWPAPMSRAHLIAVLCIVGSFACDPALPRQDSGPPVGADASPTDAATTDAGPATVDPPRTLPDGGGRDAGAALDAGTAAPVDCAPLSARGFDVCAALPDRCEVVFDDGTGCEEVCRAAGLTCQEVLENVDDACAADRTRPALACAPGTGHGSDFCVCGRGACEPMTCGDLPMACGEVADGCGGTIDCGDTCATGTECQSGRCQEPYDPQTDPAYDGYRYRPGEGFDLGRFRLPPKPECQREVTETIEVTGTFDGDGCLYYWTARAGGMSHTDICFAPDEVSEGLPPMFDLRPGATLRNVVIECAPDGIHTSRDNIIENVIMRDVEEDAITAEENVTIRNSEFWFCNDKCIQMNRANGVEIYGNRFYYATSAILANYGADVSVHDNFFYDTRRAIRSRTANSDVTARDNTHEIGQCHLWSQDDAVLYDEGGESLSGVDARHCVMSGGRIIER